MRQRLQRGLAVRTGDADDGRAATRAPDAGDLGERELRIRNHELRGRHIEFALDDRSSCTTCGNVRDKVVAIDTLAAQRDEQLPRLQLARVGDDTGELAVRAHQARTDGCSKFGQTHRDHAASFSTAAATFRSSNGCLMPSISW